jgi:signal transduction histidine kinase
VIDLDADPALLVFISACVVTAVLATLSDVLAARHRDIIRRSLLLVSTVPSLLADPTYSCLLIAIALMDVRRRDTRRVRTILTVGLLTFVAVLLSTEDTPRVTAEIEAMIGVGIAFMMISMLGDTLRKIDQGLVTRTELALLNERMRMAEELHDSVGHHLLAASVQLQKATILRTRDSHGSYQSVSMAQQAISEAIADTRAIVSATRDNRPLFSVETAIHGLVRRMSVGDTKVTIDMQGDHDELDQFTQRALYRVVQEAFSNLVRHSTATQAEISSAIKDGTTTLIIADNGRGFIKSEIQESGGLSNITRRIEDLGGTIDISTAPDGTSIIAMVPV